jgi:hypothetical protein
MRKTMALHLVKLCVGVDRVEQLTAWGREERGRGARPVVHTRQTPKRAEELLDGGSLYWVIKGVILCRQAILRVECLEDGAQTRCEIELGPEPVLVAPQPRRAFQGWRYLEDVDAPEDLAGVAGAGLPTALARELRAIGAW